MILSFHPCVVADKNIICAGRDPDDGDLFWIKKARAVILPQGCRRTLYETAKTHCRHVFPDYDARFEYPGKTGQARLFTRFNMPFPRAIIFSSLADFTNYNPQTDKVPGFDYPFVFKFDWGGESDNVRCIDKPHSLQEVLRQTAEYEKTGQSGFLIQEYIPAGNRSLRVVVIGRKRISYWRLQPDKNIFSTGVSKGALIETKSDQTLQQAGKKLVDQLCTRTGINLAGFDLLFSDTPQHRAPFFLEINYFFGRTGLGGSEKFYEILNGEVSNWLKGLKFLS